MLYKKCYFFDILYHAYHDTYKSNIIKDFTTQIKKNSRLIAKKVQMHSPIPNLIYYKYNISQSKVYKFNFSSLKILASHIDHNGLIYLKQDNI